MASKGFIHFLLKPGNWWISLSIIFIASIIGVKQISLHTYTEAPPTLLR